jgi:hypothetical protein
MKAFRVFALGLFLVVSALTAASARDITGIYLYVFSNGLGFLNLTDSNGLLTGYYQAVSSDPSQPGGISRRHTDLNGSAVPSGMVFYLGRNVLSSGSRWTAQTSTSGLLVSIPQESGQIAQVVFRRSSVTEVNSLVADFTNHSSRSKADADLRTAQARYYANAYNELTDARQRLANNLNIRPDDLKATVTRKADLHKAEQAKKDAEAEVERRKVVASEKHREADAAKAAATTQEETYAAQNLGYKAQSADYEVQSAEYVVQSRQYSINSASQSLQRAKDALRQRDARIVDLRAIIAKDNQIVNAR